MFCSHERLKTNRPVSGRTTSDSGGWGGCFLVKKTPVGIYECRSLFSEEIRRFWLSGELVVLDTSQRNEGCSPFKGPFWCCRSLCFGKFQPHFVPFLESIIPGEFSYQRRRDAFCLFLLRSFVHQCLQLLPEELSASAEALGCPESLLQPFGL